LPDGWYDEVVAKGVDTAKPGIYEWHIAGVGSYIGKYKSIRRPTRHYGRNVSRLLAGEAYRLNKPTGFRRIHEALAMAYRERRPITLYILENVDPLRINQRERELIATLGALNEPPFGRRGPRTPTGNT
jgi:hypothetical protein